jgi:hypothetical protein
VGKPSAEIEQKIQLVVGMTIGDTYQELQPAAEQAQAATLATLRELLAAALVQEDDARRLAEERAELARRQAEQAERERAERERVAAEQRAAQARIDEQRAAIAREEAEARQRREAADREAAAVREKADREARERREAEEQRLATERAALRREQEERDRRAREEEEALIASIRKNAARVEGDSSGYVQKAINAFEVVVKDWGDDTRPGVAAAVAEGRQQLAALLDSAKKREEREAAEAEERRQAEIRAEQRRQEELAAIVDKRIRDAAHKLLAALLRLSTVTRAMDAEIEGIKPTEDEYQAALKQADEAIALATVVDGEFAEVAPAPKAKRKTQHSSPTPAAG